MFGNSLLCGIDNKTLQSTFQDTQVLLSNSQLCLAVKFGSRSGCRLRGQGLAYEVEVLVVDGLVYCAYVSALHTQSCRLPAQHSQ